MTKKVLQAEEERSEDGATELSEDMEMIGPGAMLKEARLKLSLSQEEIAGRLNFTMSLVQNIEQDIFDATLPATFNRGYLSSYAKLVDIDADDVLAGYDALGAADIQRSEMLSFSKETVKQAEHSRLMWLSYFIMAVLIGLTVMWWLQDNQQKKSAMNTRQDNTEDFNITTEIADEAIEELKNNLIESRKATNIKSDQGETTANLTVKKSVEQEVEMIVKPKSHGEKVLANEAHSPPVNQLSDILLDNSTMVSEVSKDTLALSTAVFTFSGDCWVNIYDATGERIAWGVKKTGYVMTIQGQAPLKVTLGKPELASVVFNDKVVDMSAFNVGNIAKFSLPLTSN